ncbi:putative glycoside hydrolase [Methanobrevibacter sp.]|uniref:putative glycoside hydrolase n=1 Tax=Methanobrevibacter sp. TaxID=66852 RepID=UPI0025E5C3CE|nr:putative glycoside hydrolase [Methanobrevibacter sp.]MBQ2962495.1 hypothetical protein [Methanobrevibacter sp.]
MKKILALLFFALLLLSVTAVSAEENVAFLADENAVDMQEIMGDDPSNPESDGETVGDGSALSDDDGDANDIEDGDDSTEDDGNDVPAEKSNSTITASNLKGYESFTTTIKIKLTSNGTALFSRPIQISLNGILYNKTTDSNGEVKLNVKLNKGTYLAEITYLGDNLTSNASKVCNVTVLSPLKTKLRIGDKYINYRQGSKCLFYVKLLDAKNNTIKNQKVTIKVAGKTYTVTTNKYGSAKIYLNLKKGTYTVKYTFKSSSPYLASNGSCKIKFKAKMPKGDGYWLWSSDMKKVNLKSLANRGTKHIFLHANAVSRYGKSAVVSFIKKAHKHGMKVHIWMQVCYSGGKWVRPINEKNQIKYSFLNKRIKQAKNYAKIKGVDGIHFDYVRFGGTAHLYKNPNRAINYFMKKASTEVHKVNSNCIVSAALMPEPGSAMTEKFGQDVSTMSKYSDALIPMVYKGTYKKDRAWVTSVTKKFVNQSIGAQIWTGLQSYQSEKNPKKLSHSALLKDAKAAVKGGAKGIMIFRIGISCNLNFKKI